MTPEPLVPKSNGVVPTRLYSQLLDRRGEDLQRIKDLEAALRDAWLVCQAGRPEHGARGDVLVTRVLAKRVECWRAVLDSASGTSSEEANRG